MKCNGWFSHSWFNHPLLCILSVYLKELLSAGERKTQHFAVKSLGFLDTLFRSLFIDYENTDSSPASFSINNLQKIVWTKVYILQQKLLLKKKYIYIYVCVCVYVVSEVC